MYDEEKVNDSLEFIKQMKFYTDRQNNDIFRSASFMLDDIKYNEIKQYLADNNNEVNPQIRTASDPDAGFVNETEEMLIENEVKEKWNIKDWLYLAGCILVSFILVYGVTNYIAHHTYVQGSSMNETLNDRDCVIVEKVSYYLHEPERFDIVTFRYSDDVNYIKRIIGLPGEKVQIIDGYVYINDRLLEEDVYGNETIQDAGIAREPVCLGNGQYFVMGDNRNSSIDSRRDSVGMVSKEEFDGKAVFRIWPASDFGSIK